jgi:hypothetical protein
MGVGVTHSFFVVHRVRLDLVRGRRRGYTGREREPVTCTVTEKNSNKRPDCDEAVAQRLRLLRRIDSADNLTTFAARIGISMERWNNFERGGPLSKEVAILLVRSFPGITLDWLLLGDPSGLTLQRLRELQQVSIAAGHT